MFYEERNTLNTFVRPQRYTQCVKVNNTECKQNFLYKNTPQGSFKDG